MAITHDYIAWATGNDYKGATFTDGAFTVADMTLTKTGAFAASKANHWLYLDDNGSNNITPGYYRIASVTSNDAVVLATSPKSGATDPTDVVCTQHDGSAALPWRSDQGAADLCTRNATDGNQWNVVAGAAVVHTAALNLTTYGTPNYAGPLLIRGCTATANDGGIGEIDAGGATFWAAATNDSVQLIDLKLHNFGNNDGVVLDATCQVYHCEIYRGASTPTSKALLKLTGSSGTVAGCYLHDPGTSGQCLSLAANNKACGNYITTGTATGASGIYLTGAPAFLDGNIVLCGETGSYGINNIGAFYLHCVNNIVYNTTAGTTRGIQLGAAAAREGGVVVNNIVIGWSGTGGIGINGAGNTGMFGYNAFYNNTTDKTITDQTWYDLTANDIALGADPFTDAANGDFSLTTAGKAALRGLGWPAAYLGAHANTDGHVTIGAVQYGEAEGGGEAHTDDEVLDTASTPGTVHLPDAAEVIDTAVFGVSSGTSGTWHAPDAAEVIDSAVFGPASSIAGTYDTSGTPPTAAEIADAVWDEARAGHVAAGSFGAVSEWASTGGLDAAGVRTAVGLASANLDTQLGAIPTLAELQAEFAALADDTDIATAVRTELATELAEVSATNLTTDKLDTALELDGAVYRYTTNALEQAAGSAIDAQAVRDAMKLAPTAGAPAAGSVDAHLDTLIAAGGGADPLLNAVPGAYAAGTAGYIIGSLTAGVVTTVASPVSGSTITATIAASLAATLTGLTISADWAKIYLTVKQATSDADAASLLQVVVSNPAAAATDGALYVQKAAATAAQRTQASLTVTQATGAIAIALDEALTGALREGFGLAYDLKELTTSGAANVLAQGTWNWVHTATWAVT